MGKDSSSTIPMPVEVVVVETALRYSLKATNPKIFIILNAPITRGIFFVALVHVGNLQKRMGAIF